jgi:hypothetical protein
MSPTRQIATKTQMVGWKLSTSQPSEGEACAQVIRPTPELPCGFAPVQVVARTAEHTKSTSCHPHAHMLYRSTPHLTPRVAPKLSPGAAPRMLRPTPPVRSCTRFKPRLSPGWGGAGRGGPSLLDGWCALAGCRKHPANEKQPSPRSSAPGEGAKTPHEEGVLRTDLARSTDLRGAAASPIASPSAPSSALKHRVRAGPVARASAQGVARAP